MPRILVLYYSSYGHIETMAEAVAEGARETGAEVVTNGGILGKVTEVSEQFLTIEVAAGVNIKLQRHAVAQVLPKGTLKSA